MTGEPLKEHLTASALRIAVLVWIDIIHFTTVWTFYFRHIINLILICIKLPTVYKTTNHLDVGLLADALD